MSSNVDDATLEMMDRYGGSFVRALAILYRTADPVNQARVRTAFADYFAEYRDLQSVRAAAFKDHG